MFIYHLLWATVFCILDFIPDPLIWLLSILGATGQFSLVIPLRAALPYPGGRFEYLPYQALC